jgi:hypothetical protein
MIPNESRGSAHLAPKSRRRPVSSRLPRVPTQPEEPPPPLPRWPPGYGGAARAPLPRGGLLRRGLSHDLFCASAMLHARVYLPLADHGYVRRTKNSITTYQHLSLWIHICALYNVTSGLSRGGTGREEKIQRRKKNIALFLNCCSCWLFYLHLIICFIKK